MGLATGKLAAGCWMAAVALASFAGCIPSAGDDVPLPTIAKTGLDPEQKRRAEAITSVFENDTIELQYAYIENINDGRGFTAGRAGFTTATGDLALVVERYAAQVPSSPLSAFLPRLRELAASGSDSVTGLQGLPAAWTQAAADARFRAAQDAVSDELYYQPAVINWNGQGLTRALSLAAIYDAIIQHGEGDDPDGLPAMIERATQRAGGNPATGTGEAAWLDAFLDVRLATLNNATDPNTREAWRDSVDRVEPFRALLSAGNWTLEGPIAINTANHTATIP